MAEVTAVDYVLKGLRKLGAHCVKHNDIAVGIADVSACLNGVTAWIELKATERWPVRPETRVWWDHYTEEQALFLRKRKGWLLVRVGREYFLFDAPEAWSIWESRGYTRAEMAECCWRSWAGSIRWLELRKALYGV
jgi:hypothetical protein